MSESNATELIKYLTEDSLKLMYGRLNRRYVVVDALPSVDSLEPADKNVIYVVKETVDKTVRYWPNVLDNDAWKPFGIDQEDLDRKADKVSDATNGNFAGLDANGNLTDSGFKASDFKPTQTAVTDPAASGSGIEFIDSISQDTNGVIVPAKKSVQVAVASTSGVGGNAGVMSAADKEKLDGIEAGAQANTIEKVKAAGIDLDIVGKVANIPAMTGATAQGAGASGLVPAPAAGDQGKVLTGDGTWSEVEEYTDEYIDSLFAGNVVVIGGRSYPYVQIGNQLWLAENLDYKFEVNGSQIPIGVSGTPSTPSAWYYNNDETTYGADGNKYGLLYNWYATRYLEDNKSTLLPEGWRVPSGTDWDTLATAVGGVSTAGTILKSAAGWTNGAGTDDYGFNALPSGGYFGSFQGLGLFINYWTTTENTSGPPGAAYSYYLNPDPSLNSTSTSMKTEGHYVRLVKDS